MCGYTIECGEDKIPRSISVMLYDHSCHFRYAFSMRGQNIECLRRFITSQYFCQILPFLFQIFHFSYEDTSFSVFVKIKWYAVFR